MKRYEWMFVTESLSEVQEIYVEDELAGFVGGHRDVTIVTVDVEAVDAREAGRVLVERLRSAEIVVTEAYFDLVSRRGIATRVGVTPQAVGLWVRGERHEDTPFPAPFAFAGGDLWLWGEVNEWLAKNGHGSDEDVAYPSRGDLYALNHWIQSGGVVWHTAFHSWHQVSKVNFSNAHLLPSLTDVLPIRKARGYQQVNERPADYVLAR